MNQSTQNKINFFQSTDGAYPIFTYLISILRGHSIGKVREDIRLEAIECSKELARRDSSLNEPLVITMAQLLIRTLAIELTQAINQSLELNDQNEGDTNSLKVRFGDGADDIANISLLGSHGDTEDKLFNSAYLDLCTPMYGFEALYQLFGAFNPNNELVSYLNTHRSIISFLEACHVASLGLPRAAVDYKSDNHIILGDDLVGNQVSDKMAITTLTAYLLEVFFHRLADDALTVIKVNKDHVDLTLSKTTDKEDVVSDHTESQATITGVKSDIQPLVFGVWMKTMCDGFEDKKRVKIYADSEEDAAVEAVLGECHGYDEDDEDEDSDVDVNDVREAVRNKERYTDPASITDITVEYVIPLAMFDMKMIVNGQERTFKTHYPIEESGLPKHVINHYYQ